MAHPEKCTDQSFLALEPELPIDYSTPESVRQRAADLLPAVTLQFPIDPRNVQLVKPGNFDALLKLRADLQTFACAIPRVPAVKQAYDERRMQLGMIGYTLADFVIDTIIGNRRIILTKNEFPAAVPDDTFHGIIWLRSDVQRDELIDW